MTATPPPSLPAWVRKRDGRVEPFEPEKLNRALFAALEGLGRPDPFVARELTDGVLHFLAVEADGSTVPAEQVHETLVKVVRELGQPALAQALAEYRQRPPPPARAAGAAPADVAAVARLLERGGPGQDVARALAAARLEEFCLAQVYSRSLVAAHRDGLLRLHGLAQPRELSAAVVRPLPGPSRHAGCWLPHTFEALEAARRYVGDVVALDAPDRELARCGARIGEAAVFARELALAARSLGLTVVVNLGSESLPDWADESDPGPLFSDHWRPDDPERWGGLLDTLVEHLLVQADAAPLRIDWHLADRDFTTEPGHQRLTRLARAALGGGPVTFVCDHPRRPVALAEGVDRQHPALLQWVGLDLPALLRRVGRSGGAEGFLAKVLSLARLAASAGVQKRDFLRRQGRTDKPAFLLDRAHLGLTLIGLPAVVQDLLGDDIWSPAGLPFVQELARRLDGALGQEERAIHLTVLCDDLSCEPPPPLGSGEEPLPAWKHRLKTAGRWHAAFGRGTVRLPLPAEPGMDVQGFLELLHWAWKQTGLGRLCLARPAGLERQLAVTWPDGGSEAGGGR